MASAMELKALTKNIYWLGLSRDLKDLYKCNSEQEQDALIDKLASTYNLWEENTALLKKMSRLNEFAMMARRANNIIILSPVNNLEPEDRLLKTGIDVIADSLEIEKDRTSIIFSVVSLAKPTARPFTASIILVLSFSLVLSPDTRISFS